MPAAHRRDRRPAWLMAPFRKLIRPQNSSSSIVKSSQPRSSARQPVGVEEPLVGEVVNREDARRAAERRMRRVRRLEIDRREPGLPVVRVDERRPRALPRGELRAPRAPGTRIGARCRDSRCCPPRKAPRDRNSSGQSTSSARAPSAIGASMNVASRVRTADGHRKLLEHGTTGRRRGSFGSASVTSHPRPRERRRQRAEHVGEPAGLRERERLGADDQHASVRATLSV